MLQLYQDSMAICCAFHKPDIFLTMTSNPNWVKVQEAVLKEPTVNGQIQKAVDRPDIVVCVFEEKKKALLKEISDGLFGKTSAMVHTIEFQKRGLPHMHLLIFWIRLIRSGMLQMWILLYLHRFLILLHILFFIMLSHSIWFMVHVVLLIHMQSAW